MLESWFAERLTEIAAIISLFTAGLKLSLTACRSALAYRLSAACLRIDGADCGADWEGWRIAARLAAWRSSPAASNTHTYRSGASLRRAAYRSEGLRPAAFQSARGSRLKRRQRVSVRAAGPGELGDVGSRWLIDVLRATFGGLAIGTLLGC